MRWIYEPGQPYMMLALSPTEVKRIEMLLKKQLDKIEAKYEQYLDIHMSGEATVRQQNLMVEYEDLLETVKRFLELANEK